MDLLVTQARLFKPATPVNNLLDDTSSDMPEMSSSSSHTRASSRDSPSLRSYPNTPRPSKRKRKEESATSVEAVTATADAFLDRLGSTSIPEEEISSYNALTKIKSQPLSPRGENVSRAWEMCISFARRSNQKLKYGRFLRFLSLCFFLIWERHSDKQGKSAAREVYWDAAVFETECLLRDHRSTRKCEKLASADTLVVSRRCGMRRRS